MNTLERILYLKDGNGLSDLALARELGLGERIVDSWKRGNSKSYIKLIPQIAGFFGVSVSYLLCVTDDPAPLSENKEAPAAIDVAEALKVFLTAKLGRQPSETELSRVNDFFDVFIQSYTEEEKD